MDDRDWAYIQERIEALHKGLVSTPKTKQTQLVPALSSSAIKPTSMSSTGTSFKAPKMPGLAPTSTKDPKKMAEQLTNPKQKKAMPSTSMSGEVMKVDENGQWSLGPFGPHKIHPAHDPSKPGVSNMGHAVRVQNKIKNFPEHGRSKMREAYGHISGKSAEEKRQHYVKEGTAVEPHKIAIQRHFVVPNSKKFSSTPTHIEPTTAAHSGETKTRLVA